MKKNIKAFTLVELLAVIVILSLLILVAVTTVSSQFKNSKDDLYDTQLDNIRLSAEMWGSDNKVLLKSIDDCVSLTLGYLKEAGYVDVNIKNTYTKEPFLDDEVFVNITKEENRYKYEVLDDKTKLCDVVDFDFSEGTLCKLKYICFLKLFICNHK